jgi:hypothetical protein
MDNKTKREPCNAKESKADLVIQLAKENIELFHTPNDEAFASIKINGHLENIPVNSKLFRKFLMRLYYKRTGGVPGKQVLKDTIDLLSAEAIFGSPKLALHLRYAGHKGAIYIDLGNNAWNQVCITKDGWAVIESKDSPVKFKRTQGMKAMPIPSKEGKIVDLRQFLNIENESDWVLIVAWLIGAMKPTGPYPILILQGEQGTAKSTIAKLLKDLIDSSVVLLQSLPRSELDLAIAVTNSWLNTYDNLSKISNHMSDAFCRIATGGGLRIRTLFTNDDETLFNQARPQIFNGIADIARRSDLADRVVAICLMPISKEKRISEMQLMENWELRKAGILGALCNALSVALAKYKNINFKWLPRMADFAIWASAAESSFGWKEGTFMRAYENNRLRLIDIAIEADPVALAVIDMIEKENGYKWSGKASDLLEILKSKVGEQVTRLKSWPKQPNFLSNNLRRCATSLREKGISIEWIKSGDRIITIAKTVQTAQTVHYDNDEQDLNKPELENKIRPANIASSQSVSYEQANDYDDLQDEVI